MPISFSGKNLNVVMERNDVVKPNFKGFMTDSA
jgi:hypothetical protein